MVLVEILLEFHPLLAFIESFSFQLFTVLLKWVLVLFKYTLIIGLLSEFILIVRVEFVKLIFMHLRDLTDELLIIRSTTVFKQNREHFPDLSDDSVSTFSVL